MGKKEEYERRRNFILNDKKINEANRKLFKKFFDLQEYKLKRKNGLKELDNSCYKTLCGYPAYFANVNRWFKNKEWKKLTKADIKKVYDDLEDGKLKGTSGKIITGKSDYYNKIFKSKPFELAGKKEIAKKVMEYYNNNTGEEVRFFEEETFKKTVNKTKTTSQRLLCWLAWDFGENIFTLLQLQKKDFTKRIDNDTKEPEYILNFPNEKIKRTRTSRSEPTLYKETVDLLDAVLPNLKEDDQLFNFEHRNALKFLKEIREKIEAKCIPKGQPITWKDFRSSMACYLLDNGWTTDEIKSRLGHKPSSNVLDKYLTYKALNKKKPKKKVEEGRIRQLSLELEDLKLREKIFKKRIETIFSMLEDLDKNKVDLKNLSTIKN